MIIKYIKSKYVNAHEAEEYIGTITHKQVLKLYDLKPLKSSKKLFEDDFDMVEFTLISRKILQATYRLTGKPGFRKDEHLLLNLQSIRYDWINSPILNRSGLATLIWDDLKPNNLRRRLEQRVQHVTFTETEKEIIVNEVEAFLTQIKKSFEL